MSASNQPPTCPSCPGDPILLPGEDSYYVCYKCGYTSSIAATFFDERDEMLQQMDANERYSGLLKDNMLGAARLMRSSTGVVYAGQAEVRSAIYRQARGEALKVWSNQLSTVKFGLPDHIGARAYHVAERLIDSLVQRQLKKNRSILDKYLHAAVLVIIASEQKRVINHLEVASAAGLNHDKLRYFMAFCRKELNIKYDGTNQATSYIETVLRHIKAIIETPEESRLYDKETSYPDETLHFLHSAHPVLLDVRKMSTELAEMLAALSVNYARNPAISACSIVMAAMEGVTGSYTSQNGDLFEELAYFLPKASSFTVRERYLEILNVVFDLGQYLGDIGHPVETIPVWRQMGRRPPPKRHLFVTFLPLVIRHWKQLSAWQRAHGKVPVQAEFEGEKLEGERLWKILLPNKELPKSSIRGKKGASDEGEERGETPAASSEQGAPEVPQKLPDISQGVADDASQVAATPAKKSHKKKGTRTAAERKAAGEERPAKKSRASLRTPEEAARHLARAKLLRRERDMKRRERQRLEAYGRRPSVALASEDTETTGLQVGDKQVKGHAALPFTACEATNIPHPDAALALKPNVEQRTISLRNRAIYERKRKLTSAECSRKAARRSRGIIAFLSEWQRDHVGEAVEKTTDDDHGHESDGWRFQSAILRRLLLSGTHPGQIPDYVFPTSTLTARLLLNHVDSKAVDALNDDALFGDGELDGYVCTATEQQIRLRQWNEDDMDQYLPKNQLFHTKDADEAHNQAEKGYPEDGHTEDQSSRDFNDAVNDMFSHASIDANDEADESDDEDDDEGHESDRSHDYNDDGNRQGFYGISNEYLEEET